MAYLDDTGLAYFWGKIKVWAQGLFALIGHTHAASDVTAMTGYSKPASGSAIAAGDTLNQAVGKLEAKVDAVDDSNYVHKTGTEVIDGEKTFKGVYERSNAISGILIRHPNLTRGDSLSSTHYWQIALCDINGTDWADAGAHGRCGNLLLTYDSQGNSNIRISAYKNAANNTTTADLVAGVLSDGTVYATAPETSTSRNARTDIVTRGFLEDKGYLTSHQPLPSLSLTTSGSGNAITALSVSGHAITATKGSTFLTSVSGTAGTSTLAWNSEVTLYTVGGHAIKAKLPANPNSDTLVTQNVSTTNATYPLLLCPTANATANQGAKTAIFPKSVKVNASTNELYATKLHADNAKDLSSNGLYDTTNTGSLFVCGGSSINTSSHIKINGYQASSFSFMLRALSPTSTSTYADLVLDYGGTLKWKGQTVQTSSDERLKTPISSVDDDVLDAWDDVYWGQFKFLDAVEEKGDNARFHVGLIAQGVDRTCIAKNVDIRRYGILCHDEWEDEYVEEDGKQVLYNKAGDIWMVRYTEALCMEAAYQRRENARLKKRVADLEDRLAALELRLGSE